MFDHRNSTAFRKYATLVSITPWYQKAEMTQGFNGNLKFMFPFLLYQNENVYVCIQIFQCKLNRFFFGAKEGQNVVLFLGKKNL
jgi:hypothetical protein